jgi:hypothetical protein
VVRVQPDGSARQVADGLQWPNGMALIDDDRTLVVADSHAEQLVGFDVARDGTLSGRRVWAALEHAPDGICADAEGAIWVASVPGQHCVRVRDGGEMLDTIAVDRGCFACMLGGEDGRTLFIAAAEWRGMEAAMNQGPGQRGGCLLRPDSEHDTPGVRKAYVEKRTNPLPTDAGRRSSAGSRAESRASEQRCRIMPRPATAGWCSLRGTIGNGGVGLSLSSLQFARR